MADAVEKKNETTKAIMILTAIVIVIGLGYLIVKQLMYGNAYNECQNKAMVYATERADWDQLAASNRFYVSCMMSKGYSVGPIFGK